MYVVISDVRYGAPTVEWVGESERKARAAALAFARCNADPPPADRHKEIDQEQLVCYYDGGSAEDGYWSVGVWHYTGPTHKAILKTKGKGEK